MLEKLKITDYIDERNKKIWLFLKDLYDIQLLYNSNETSWIVRDELESNKWVISTPSKKQNISSFTHELLHIYIEHLGMPSPRDFGAFIVLNHDSTRVEILLKRGLFSKIHNFLSHTKMFPFFIEMGFNEKEFIGDRANVNWLHRWLLKTSIKKSLDAEVIADYIGNTLSIMCNEGLSYQKRNKYQLEKIKNINPQLFQIVERFYNSWLTCSHLNINIIASDFINELEFYLEQINLSKK